MANTHFSTLRITGPDPARQRFADALALADMHEFFSVHVPLAAPDAAYEAWGTGGVKSVTGPFEEEGATEYGLQTLNAPPHRWLGAVAAQCPTLSFELWNGCFEEGIGRYIRAERGAVVTDETTTEDLTGFFAQRRRPSFFIPYWEDEEVLAEEAFHEAMAALLEAARREEAEELQPSIAAVESGHPWPRVSLQNEPRMN